VLAQDRWDLVLRPGRTVVSAAVGWEDLVAAQAGDQENAGHAALAMIEELSSYLSNDELRNAVDRLHSLIDNTQDISVLRRLGRSVCRGFVFLYEHPGFPPSFDWTNFSFKSGVLEYESRALLFGRLADIWWSQDVERARILLQKAIAEVESRSADDNKSDRLRRNSVLTTLLTIAAPLDERYTDQLTEMLKQRAGKPIDQEASESATALAQAALTVLDVDPTRAAALGSASLRAGRSRSLANVLSRLRLRSKALGDALFNEALMTAAARSDGELLTSLIIIAFKGPAPSDDLRRSVVVAIEREFVGNSRQTAVNRGCSLAPTIAPLLGEFDRVLPQSAATIRGGLIRCQKSHNPSSDATVDRVLNNERVETVSDLLDAASKARTIDDRVLFLGRAANLAAQQGNFEQAVTILDGLAEEERKALGDVWSDWRWDFAASAAVARLKN